MYAPLINTHSYRVAACVCVCVLLSCSCSTSSAKWGTWNQSMEPGSSTHTHTHTGHTHTHCQLSPGTLYQGMSCIHNASSHKLFHVYSCHTKKQAHTYMYACCIITGTYKEKHWRKKHISGQWDLNILYVCDACGVCVCVEPVCNPVAYINKLCSV